MLQEAWPYRGGVRGAGDDSLPCAHWAPGRDRLEEAGQGQEAASSEEASSLVVSNPDFLGRGTLSVTPYFPIGSCPELTRRRLWRPLRIGPDLWLLGYIL